MRVLVYVEGPADVSALQTLLRPIVDAGRKQGVGINFLRSGLHLDDGFDVCAAAA